MTSRYALDLPQIRRYSVGFDRLFEDLFKSGSIATNTYPPYNVVQHDETHYAIQVAVAGFNESELNVEIQNGYLTITGQRVEQSDDSGPTYLYKGIGTRSFSRQIALADNMEVRGATVKNGILNVEIEHIIPEEAKPKKVAITFSN